MYWFSFYFSSDYHSRGRKKTQEKLSKYKYEAFQVGALMSFVKRGA